MRLFSINIQLGFQFYVKKKEKKRIKGGRLSSEEVFFMRRINLNLNPSPNPTPTTLAERSGEREPRVSGANAIMSKEIPEKKSGEIKREGLEFFFFCYHLPCVDLILAWFLE